MAFDPDFASIHTKASEERANRIKRRTYHVTMSVGNWLTINENDETVEIIETLLGIKPGGNAKVRELLGFSGNTDEETERPALEEPEAKRLAKNWITVYEANGVDIAPEVERLLKTNQEEGIKKYDLVLFEDKDGKPALKKRPVVPAVPVPPAPAGSGDHKVPVLTRKGARRPEDITVREGNADPNLEAILSADGTEVDHFQEKAKWAPKR